jgi:hypothetical protein
VAWRNILTGAELETPDGVLPAGLAIRDLPVAVFGVSSNTSSRPETDAP